MKAGIILNIASKTCLVVCVFVICLTSAAPAQAKAIFKEEPVYIGAGDQGNPALSGNKVVWVGGCLPGAYISPNIFMKDFRTQEIKNLSPVFLDNYYSPDIDGDRVVWSRFWVGVSLYDTRANTHQYLHKSTFAPSNPRIDGDRVVYRGKDGYLYSIHYNLGEIYVYDLKTGTEKRIDGGTQTLDNQYWVFSPDISGDLVVWVHEPELRLYNLTSNEMTVLKSGEFAQFKNPVISGKKIAWQNSEEGTSISLLDLITGKEKVIATGSSHKSPTLSSDILVWQDNRNGNWDIYMYNLHTGEISQVTDNPANQTAPSINGNRIVWTDDRNGNNDIYMARITSLSKAGGVGTVSGQIVDGQDKVIPSARIRVDDDTNITFDGRDGRFIAGMIPTGWHTIYYDAPGHEGQTQFVEITTDNIANMPKCMLTQTGSDLGEIFGRVIDGNGQPIPGTAVRIGNTVIPANQSGYFRFGLVHPGIYIIYYDAPGFVSQTQVIEVKPNQSVICPTAIPQRPSGAIRGKVIDQWSKPIPDVSVKIGVTEKRTNMQGEYSFTGLYPGCYTLSVTTSVGKFREGGGFEVIQDQTVARDLTIFKD